MRTDIVALTAGGPHAWITINALRQHFGAFPVIREEAEPASIFWRRRLRLLGPLQVASMMAARLPIKLMKRGSGQVIAEMIEQETLKPEPARDQVILEVPSVNHKETRTQLSRLNPKVVFVVSARMIGTKTLSAVEAPFINYHSGINPAYRGMFGGYFALANGEPEHFGATVHLIDQGVDTGGILYQARVHADPADNFHTYIWRIAAKTRHLVTQAVEDALNGHLVPYAVDLPSNQYFAPTLGGYLKAGLMRGVW